MSIALELVTLSLGNIAGAEHKAGQAFDWTAIANKITVVKPDALNKYDACQPRYFPQRKPLPTLL